MIILKLYFKQNIRKAMLETFMVLPEEIKPYCYSISENKKPKTNLFGNNKKFWDFDKKNSLGYFLYGKGFLIDLSFSKARESDLTVYFKDESLVDIFSNNFKNFDEIGVLYGFICDEEEFYHRNTYEVTIGINNISSRVGLNLNKHLFGIYWKTYVSFELIEKHQLNFEDFSDVRTMNKGLFVTLYDLPIEWSHNIKMIDEWCKVTKGVYSISVIEEKMKEIDLSNMTVLEYMDLIDSLD